MLRWRCKATVLKIDSSMSCPLNDVSKRLAYFGREAVASARRRRLNCVCASQATEHATPLQFVSLHFHKASYLPQFPLPSTITEHRSSRLTPQLLPTTVSGGQRSHISSHGAKTGYSWVCQVFSDYSRVRRHLRIVIVLCGKADMFV